MKRRLLAGALAAAMALSMTACGSGGGSSADQEGGSSGEKTKMTLILRGGTYAEALKASLPDFEAEHNVSIEVQELSFDDLHTGIALDATNPDGSYDLCMVDGSWMAEFTENEVLANLSEMGYSFDDDIIEATTSICKVGDDIYLAPFFGNVTVMMYNKELIKAAGYEPEDITTFDDLMDIAKKTHDAGKTGFLIRGGSADNIVSDFIPHLLVHGGWVVDDSNKPTVNTPEFKAAMQEYLDLYALYGIVIVPLSHLLYNTTVTGIEDINPSPFDERLFVDFFNKHLRPVRIVRGHTIARYRHNEINVTNRRDNALTLGNFN